MENNNSGTLQNQPLNESEERELRELELTWARPGGIVGWFTDTDHKAIALRYVVTAFIFFLLGGIEAALMRIQLARPESHFLNPDLYNQVFTVHGTTMMFLFAVPIMTALGIYLVPLMIGTRDVAFPRLNSYGYFVYLIGGILLYTSFVLNIGPDAGRFSRRCFADKRSAVLVRGTRPYRLIWTAWGVIRRQCSPLGSSA